MYQLNLFQMFFIPVFVLWLMCLGLATMIHRHEPYLQWTWTSLQGVWRHAWQFIIGCIVGYVVAVGPRLPIHL